HRLGYHRDLHSFPTRRSSDLGEIPAEVVDDLRGDARPVDRIDRADRMAPLEEQVAGDGLDEILALVEDALDRDVEDVRVGERVQDRKSTRLNSSHVKISYAVF